MLEKWISVGITLVIMIVVLLVVNQFFKGITKKFAAMHLNFFKSTLNVVIVIVGIYSCLSQFEIAREVSRTILQSGTLIIAVATFAAQAALGNVVSGFVLSSNRPCNIGQYVVFKQGETVIAEGIVTDMTIRHVIIRQFDGQRAIVPNSVVDKCTIVNTNYEASVGRMLEVQVGYDTDIPLAKRIILDLVEKEELIIEKERTGVGVVKLGESGISLKFGVWAKNTDDSFAVCSSLREKIVTEFRKAGITIPYKTITIDTESSGKDKSKEQNGL